MKKISQLSGVPYDIDKVTLQDYSIIRSLFIVTSDFSIYKKYGKSIYMVGIKDKIATQMSVLHLERLISSLYNLYSVCNDAVPSIIPKAIYNVKGFVIVENKSDFETVNSTFLENMRNIRNKYTHLFNSDNQYIVKHFLIHPFLEEYKTKTLEILSILIQAALTYLNKKYEDRLVIPHETYKLLNVNEGV